MSESIPEPPEPPFTWPYNVEALKFRLRQLWQGQIPLAQTFWLYYFLGVLVLKSFSRAQGPFGGLFDVLALGWAGFMIKPIIASADHYQGDRIWNILAKIAAIIIAIAVLSDLLAF